MVYVHHHQQVAYKHPQLNNKLSEVVDLRPLPLIGAMMNFVVTAGLDKGRHTTPGLSHNSLRLFAQEILQFCLRKGVMGPL